MCRFSMFECLRVLKKCVQNVGRFFRYQVSHFLMFKVSCWYKNKVIENFGVFQEKNGSIGSFFRGFFKCPAKPIDHWVSPYSALQSVVKFNMCMKKQSKCHEETRWLSGPVNWYLARSWGSMKNHRGTSYFPPLFCTPDFSMMCPFTPQLCTIQRSPQKECVKNSGLEHA